MSVHGRWLRALTAMLSVAMILMACGSDEPEEPADPVEEPEDADTEPAADSSEPEPQPEPAPEPGPTSFLTGEEVDDDVLERPLLVVKIENSPQARPQSGLDAADVVIEEVVEAGVTRFMAMFHSQIPDDVGPTRSARPVDAQLIAAYGRSGFIYSGARSEVVGMLSNTPALQIAEGGPGFHRIGDRAAPHNLYNRLPEAMEAIRGRDPEILDDVGWTFDDDAPAGEDQCPTTGGTDTQSTVGADDTDCTDPGAAIAIQMSKGYRTSWTYDEDSAVYRRFQNGEPFRVTGPDTIGAANVVVLATRHYLGQPNCYGSPCPETDVLTDGARAIVLRDGKRYEARWRKQTAGDHLQLFTGDGEVFPLKPGPTWVHLPSAERMPAPIG